MSLKVTGGFLKNRSVKCPSQVARPTKSIIRESFFNIIQTSIQESLFLDLFSGSGIIGIEAISRGAYHTTFIDQSSFATRVIQENLKSFNIKDKTTVILSDVNKGLNKLKQKFSIVYLDPPYDLEQSYLIKTFSILIPLIEENGFIFLERRSKEPPLQIDGLSYVKTRTFGTSSLHQYCKS